jgi:hypothetical protein
MDMSEHRDLHLEQEHSVTPQKIPVLAPKPIWLECLWVFGTFGIYLPFWFVRRTQELKRFNGSNFTPWMWFFAPLFPLFQAFAFPKLVKELQQIQINIDLPVWTAWSSTWYVFVVSLSLIFNLSDKYAIPTWIIFIAMIADTGLHAALFHQIAKIKLSHPNLDLKVQKKSTRFFEIVLTSFLSICILIIFCFLSYDGLKGAPIEKYKSGGTYKDSTLHFQLTVLGQGWSRVSAGTYSEDPSEAEFKGPNENMYFIVFSYDKSESLTTITHNRIINIKDVSESTNCTHKRNLNSSQSGVVIKIICKYSGYKELGVNTSTIIETDNGFIELFGDFTSQPNTYKKYEQDFINMASSLKEI